MCTRVREAHYHQHNVQFKRAKMLCVSVELFFLNFWRYASMHEGIHTPLKPLRVISSAAFTEARQSHGRKFRRPPRNDLEAGHAGLGYGSRSAWLTDGNTPACACAPEHSHEAGCSQINELITCVTSYNICSATTHLPVNF